VSRPDAERLADIVDAADELAEVIAVGQQGFLVDPMRIRAAERLLEIIGEASSTLSDETTRKYPDVAWPDIRRLRVLLAHRYHRVDADQVWTIASEDVPELACRLRSG
jgi:uncharacterized protein with HEPN domain